MPLEVLAPVVLFGIAFVVLLVRLLVNHPARLLDNVEMVETLFLSDYPTASSGSDWIISDDKRVAICRLSLPLDAVGLVEVLGSKHVTRVLFAEDIGSVEKAEGMIRIVLRDFTLSGVDMIAEDEGKQDGILSMIDLASRAHLRNKDE